MKRSRLPGGHDGRASHDRERARRRGRLAVESLETRSLLSTAHAATAVHAKAGPARPTYPPYAISLQIGPASDPGGDGHVFGKNVLVQGFAAPFSTIWIATAPTGYYTNVARSTASGLYGAIVPIGRGTTQISAFAESPAQNYSLTSTIRATSSNPIVAWDSIALRAIRNLALPAPEAARDLAILHAAQYDAVAAIAFPRAAYRVHAPAPKGASAEAAATAAADTALESLFPSQAPAFRAALAAAKADFPANRATADGLALGQQVALATLADRAGDGSAPTVVDLGSATTGLWRPTAPGFAPATDPQWGLVKPFLIGSAAQSRPAAPPAVGTAVYDRALAEVAGLGRLTSTTRTQDQSNAAGFWGDGAGSLTDPGHWNEIAEQIAVGRGDSLAKDARLFALLDFALADSAIAVSDAQYTYNTWRPISAIQPGDPTWVPLISTPASPGYVSDNAAYSSAAADILSATFGAKSGFTDNLYASAGVTRSYPGFAAAAAEDANSRIWGGVNTSSDVQQGSILGDQVGKAALANFPKVR